MSTKTPKQIEIRYICSEIPYTLYEINVTVAITSKELLNIINKQQKDDYVAIFKDYKLINDHYCIDDHDLNTIFYASALCLPPQEKYMKTLNQTDKWKEKKLQSSFSTYSFFLAGSKLYYLLYGINVDLIRSMNVNECKGQLLKSLRQEKVDIEDKDLIVFFPGGIPFTSGTLSDIYSDDKKLIKNVIYGVLIPPIPYKFLSQHYENVCDASDSSYKTLISPLCDSSERGISDITCFLGYLNNNGKEKINIIKSYASRTNYFAPLIISMYKVCMNDVIIGLDIVTICTSIFTYLRDFLPEKAIPDNQVFEYLFLITDKISYEIDEILPIKKYIMKLKISEEQSIIEISPNSYFWFGDAFENFPNEKIFNLNIKLDKNKDFTSSILVKPDSIDSESKCLIVKGKRHECLYVKKIRSCFC